MFEINACCNCLHCQLFRVEPDTTGKYNGAVDENGFWFNPGDSLRCSRHYPAPFFPRQIFCDKLTKCRSFVYDDFFKSNEEWEETMVIMKPNALKEDVAHDMALAKKIERMVRYENCFDDLGHPWFAEGDPLRQAMIRGDGNEVCRLLGIKDRFRLYKDEDVDLREMDKQRNLPLDSVLEEMERLRKLSEQKRREREIDQSVNDTEN